MYIDDDASNEMNFKTIMKKYINAIMNLPKIFIKCILKLVTIKREAKTRKVPKKNYEKLNRPIV